jgi:PAS domain S-box-containing protein
MTEDVNNVPYLIPLLRRVILLAPAYMILGAAGLTLAIPPGYASPVFPAAGFALACGLWFGRGALLAVWMGSALLNLSHAWLGGTLSGATAAVAAVIATGAWVQAWLGCYLVNRWQGPAWMQLEREQDVFAFLLLGGVLAGMMSATISVAGLQLFGVIEPAVAPFTWWNWYVGDVLGILVFAPLTLCLLNRQNDLWHERRRRILAPMLLALALVVAAFYGASQWEQQAQDSQLKASSDKIAERIDDRLISHREVLSSLRHFIETIPEFSFRQFEQFTRITLQDNPDIFALSFNDLIAEEDRPAFEQMMSTLSPLGPYQITERDSQKQLVRAATRPEYVAVRYIVPLANNQPAVGYDIYSEPVRRDAIDRARTSNSMAVTAPIRLVQEQQQRIGILELLPVREAHAAGDEDREGRPFGFAVAVVKVDEMIEIATRDQVPSGLVFQLIDPYGPAAQTLLYGSHLRGAARVPLPKTAPWKSHLRMGDRDWELSVYTTERYRQEHRPWVAWAVGMAGLIFATLLQILMLGMTGRTAVIQRKNEELKTAEGALRDLNIHLEQKVEERTTELAAAQNQTERALAQVAKSEALFRAMVEQAPLGVALADSVTARISEVNEQFARIVGRTREELTSIDWIQITHPDDLPEQLDKMARLNAGEITGYQMNKRYVRPDGSPIWISLTVAPVIVEAGENPHHLAMVEDITERREAEERLRCITDSAYDAILMMDPQGAITYWNPAAEKILGFRADEVLGKNLHEQLAPERYIDEYLAAFPEFQRTGRGNAVGKTLELFARHKDGREIAVAVSLAGVSLKGGWHAVGILRDITVQRELEENLRTAKQAAEAANAAKGEFLAHMSHEIRTPLNTLLGMADMLCETNLNPEQRTYVQIFKKSGTTLLSLINDILDLSKIEAGQVELEETPFSLPELIHRVVELMRVPAVEKGIELSAKVAADVPVALTGDAERLRQILLNLIANAIKFTPRGTVTLSVRRCEANGDRETTAVRLAHPSETADEALLSFSVADTGIGIEEDRLGHIFERFTQADSSITRQYGGSGLGLTISRHLTELMGGSIQVESAVGRGSVFTVQVPFGIDHGEETAGYSTVPDSTLAVDARLGTESAPEPPEGTAMDIPEPSRMETPAPLRILLVEDTEENRVLVHVYLKKTPWIIDDAENGLVALQRFTTGSYDLVLMDVQMPVMDGYTATREMRKWEMEKGRKPTPVIALTAHAFADEKLKSLDAGCTAHLTKPIDKKGLLAAIEQYAEPRTRSD